MTIVAGDENNWSKDKENEVVRMVTISDRNIDGQQPNYALRIPIGCEES